MATQTQQPDTALHNTSHLMQYHDLIESIVAAMDARDAYTAKHSDRVADMVLVLAAALGLSGDETTLLHMAAHLHDIGKIAVPDSVLRKAGPLTNPEWEEMRRHPVTGYEILRKVDDFKEIAVLVRHHHERWDGRGYPDGLAGDEIPISAQIVSIADVYDALVSKRVYKAAYPPDTAVQMILHGDCGQFNPLLLECLVEIQDILKAEIVGRGNEDS